MKYRKVMFNEWIPYQYFMDESAQVKHHIKGTGCYNSGFKTLGLFHGFFKDEDCVIIGLVEDRTGVVRHLSLNNFKFTDTQNYLNE